MSARGSGGAPGAPPAGSGAEPQKYWLGGLGERYELPQRGLGRSPSRWRIFDSFHAKTRLSEAILHDNFSILQFPQESFNFFCKLVYFMEELIIDLIAYLRICNRVERAQIIFCISVQASFFTTQEEANIAPQVLKYVLGRGSGGALWASPAGSMAEPQPLTHFW